MPRYTVTLDVKCWRTDYIDFEASSEEEAESLAIKYWQQDPDKVATLCIGSAEADCEELPTVIETSELRTEQ